MAILPFASGVCDVPLVANLALDNNTAQFVQNARLVSADQILDALDLHYRLHWAARQAGLDQRPSPAGVDAGVLQERHYALNWLVQFENADWDNVLTPT